MRWLAALLITASAWGQPVDELRDVETPAELVRVVENWVRGRPTMTMHKATFDAGDTLTGDMAVTFDRDTAAYDWDGSFEGDAVAVAADEARYGGDVRVFEAPTLETVDATAGGWMVYSSGKDASGNTVVVVRKSATAHLLVYKDGATPTTLSDKALYGGANKPTATIGDILAGETDEEADYTHDPRAVVCLPGLILVQCNVSKHDGVGSRTLASSYDIWGVSLVYSTDNGATWELAWRSGDLTGVTPPDDYGAEWSLTAVSHERDGSEDDYWVGLTSYASGGDRGAHAFVCRATGGVGSWSISNAHQFAMTNGSATQTHSHWCGCFEDPANTSGLKLIVEVGDSNTDNRTEEYLCSSKSGFLTGGSAVTGATNVVDGGSNWSGPTYINGKIGAGAANEWMAAQTVGYAPGPAGGFYSGGDEEQGGPLFYATVPATNGARINWQDAYAVRGTTPVSAEAFNWRCFSANAWDHDAANPAVAANIAPGNSWDTGNGDAARFLYKPAGETVFGVVYAAQDEESAGANHRAVVTPSGYIWFGTANNHGLRRFPVPTRSRTQRAIHTGPGGTNLALATPAQQIAPGTGNTWTIGTETPPATPPTPVAAVHMTIGTSSNNAGYLRLTSDRVNTTHTQLTVQVLFYQDTDAADVAAECYFRARFATVEAGIGNATPFQAPKRLSSRGRFVLATYTIENGVDWNILAGDSAQKIYMQFQTDNSSVHPGEWWLWVVGVYHDADCPPSYFLPGDTTGDNESLVLDGFTCGDAWTVYLVGVLGDTGRDARHYNAGNARAIATLYESATKYIELRLDASDGFAVHVQDAVTNPTHSATGLPLQIRNDPVVVAVSWNGSAYQCWYSISGSAWTELSMPSGAAVKPTSIKLGSNAAGSVFEATRWLHAKVLDSEASIDPVAAFEDVVNDTDTGRRTRSRDRRVR